MTVMMWSNRRTVLVVLVMLIPAASTSSSWGSRPLIALPGCPHLCGNISIPYPFGIGRGCFLNSWYNVTCDNTTSGQVIPFLASLNWNSTLFSETDPVQILNIDTTPISLASPLPSLVVRGPPMGLQDISFLWNISEYINLDMRGTPFLLMPLFNTLVVIGCGGSGILGNIKNQSVIGCTTVCPDKDTAQTIQNGIRSTSTTLYQMLGNSDSCFGMGCCQTSLPTTLDYFKLESRIFDRVSNFSNTTNVLIALVRPSDFANALNGDKVTTATDFIAGATNVLQWSLQASPNDVRNQTSASCYVTEQGGYYCRCNDRYHGNPYLPQGCQANFPDAYSNKSPVAIALGLGISLGSISLSIIFYGLFRFLKVRKEIRQKQSNFKKNGGLLLQQQMSANEGAFDRTKVFTCNELEKATDNFNENRILGQGGQGTVYKGMLLDGTIIAVKKSKKVDEGQLGQFINELVILSQVVHRNVVKLFGCCLETEVPLLVYEFVPNGTLFQHIHNPREDFYITWKMRLQIAIELAEALTYLHSSSFVPIYHRDIKTSNILLDDRYKGKLADFGISKTVSIDQTHVTTNIQGTFGYIDPEYFQSNQFTEKSDVYSFGIVLLELLSSKKPVYVDKSTDTRSLASEFLLCMQQFRLRDIIDADVLKVANMEELEGVADLAKRCLNLNGNKRPTMREVVMTLQMINSENGVPHSSLEQIVIGKDHTSLVDEGPSSIPPPPTLSEESFIYTQPLLFDTNSDL